MKMPGHRWTLDQFRTGLRVSTVLWLVWIFIVETALKAQYRPLADYLISTLLTSLPALALLPILWRGNHGLLLIFTGMVMMIYLGSAAMGMLHGSIALPLYGVETVLLLGMLFFIMWLIERLPKMKDWPGNS